MKPTNPGSDYAARQAALHAKREAEGHYTPEEICRRAGLLNGGREYNARIAAMFDKKEN